MKIQLIFLAVCVVTSFALPERRNFNNRHSELTEQREQELERQNTNQESSNVGDEFIDVRDESVDEKTISPNEMKTEKSKCSWMSRSQKNNMRKHWLKKHEGERRHRNDGTALSNEQHQRPFSHTTIWQEKQTLFPEANPGAETRHHHRHHHHHRNCTTTTVPPTTTAATNTPLSEE